MLVRILCEPAAGEIAENVESPRSRKAVACHAACPFAVRAADSSSFTTSRQLFEPSSSSNNPGNMRGPLRPISVGETRPQQPGGATYLSSNLSIFLQVLSLGWAKKRLRGLEHNLMSMGRAGVKPAAKVLSASKNRYKRDRVVALAIIVICTIILNLKRTA